MASGHIVFGKIKREGVLDSSALESFTVTSGNTSNASNSSYNFVSVTAIGGNIYVAFSANTPNANSNPRVYIPQNGSINFSCAPNTKVAILDA